MPFGPMLTQRSEDRWKKPGTSGVAPSQTLA